MPEDLFDMAHLDIEPDDPPKQAIVVRETGIAELLPSGFPLQTLLVFVPDIQLKRRAIDLAAVAKAVDVTSEHGLIEADAALVPLRAIVKEIELCFDGTEMNPGPTALAYQLHKRLTGLRGDFVGESVKVIEAVGRSIYTEKKRLDDQAAAQRRLDQEAANREVRENAAKAAVAAEERQAPVAVVETLRRQAETATAPPVAARPSPTLASSSAVAKWKARFAGTPADSEPNPATADMTEEQQSMFKALCLAVGQGKAPLASVEPGWSYINARAAKEKTTLDIVGIETYDAGTTRGKGGRK